MPCDNYKKHHIFGLPPLPLSKRTQATGRKQTNAFARGTDLQRHPVLDEALQPVQVPDVLLALRQLGQLLVKQLRGRPPATETGKDTAGAHTIREARNSTDTDAIKQLYGHPAQRRLSPAAAARGSLPRAADACGFGDRQETKAYNKSYALVCHTSILALPLEAKIALTSLPRCSTSPGS